MLAPSHSPRLSITSSPAHRLGSRVVSRRVTLRVMSSAQPSAPQRAESGPSSAAVGDVLLVGISGKTGRSALQGLLASGLPPASLHVLTTNPSSPTAEELRGQGLAVVGGNLDDPATLPAALQGVGAVYVHALSKDAAKADPLEVQRARRLCTAMREAGVRHVVYNSSAGRGCKAGISQMDQKHAIEDMFAGELLLTALQATLFMEELWKKYTRPAILKGKFSFAVPGDKPLQMVAVKDMGRVAAQALVRPDEFIGHAIPLAGDELTPLQMCEAFARAQGTPVAYQKMPAWPFWLFNRDLYRICRFYSTQGYDADVAACRARFGLQDFDSFLQETSWGDSNATMF